jgi:TonB family protein
MHRIKFIHQPQSDRNPVHTRRAFLASCAFHGLALGLLLWLTFFYRAHLPLPKSGSAPGASIITLETMVVVTPAPQPIQPPAPIPPAHVALPTPKPPDAGVPVLAIKIIKPTPPAPVKIQAPPHPVLAQNAPSHPKPAAASSYAPGLNLLPHPPYPLEARNLGQTGTVIMNVQFDAGGNVIRAEVAQSSGVPLLDSTTRSFIRAHWHSAAYAGQTISQPVEYLLENL